MTAIHVSDAAQAIARHRWLIVAAVLAVAAAAGFGAGRLELSHDYRVFFDSNNPDIVAHDRLEASFTGADNVAFVLSWPEGDIFTAERLAVIDSFAGQAWKLPHVTRVDSITGFQNVTASGDDIDVGPLVSAPSTLTAEDIAGVRDIALTDPMTAGRLVARDGRAALVNASAQLPEDGERAQLKVAAAARRLAETFEADHPDLQISLTGIIMLADAFQSATRADLTGLFPIMFAVIAAGLVGLLGSFRAGLAAMAVVGLSIAATLGLFGWLGYQLNPASGVAPIVIMTIAIADSIHILISYFKAFDRADGPVAAISESLRINRQPVFLTSVTTAIGFLSLNFSDSPVIQDLGTICATGAMVAWALSMTFLPALIRILDIGPVRRFQGAGTRMARFVNGVIARRRTILLATGALAVLAAAALPRLQIDDRYVELFDRGHPFREDAERAAEKLPGLYFFEFAMESGAPGGIQDPEYLAHVDAFAQWLRAQPEVAHVAAFSDLMRKLNQALHGGRAEAYRLPERRKLAAQYLLLYEFSLPLGLDLNNTIDVAKSKTRLTVTLHNIGSRRMEALRDRAEAWLDDNVPAAMAGKASGVALIFARLTDRNVRSMLLGTAIALVLISACLMAALRDMRMGVISLLPNLTPAILAFAVWALTFRTIGLWASAVVAASLGLIVDFTVHFLSKYRLARTEKGLDCYDGVRDTFATVGAALWISAVVLLGGFAALSFSDFVINANFGLMTALIILIALLTDFLVLPALLITLDRDRPSRQPARPGTRPDSTSAPKEAPGDVVTRP